MRSDTTDGMPKAEAATTSTGRRAGSWRPVLLIALGAIALRLVLLLGRGDYLAFDEGFYLLLARSLYTGDGFSLIGIPHTALSPLFPLLAGAAGVALDSWVWGGRVVAAVAAGLLVLPAWATFRRLTGRREALTAIAMIAVLPPLAPFVVPFWIGADLWVGAEPLLHLLLYTGLAAWLWADEAGPVWRWGVAGMAFGLAYLARPEAIITWGLLGLAALALALRHRSMRRFAGAAIMGIGFVVVALPYWGHLHDVTGRWTLTGRSVTPAAAGVQLVRQGQRQGSAPVIEGMLWGDDTRYERYLYSLDPTGLRLQADYWGVYPQDAPVGAETQAPPPPGSAQQEGVPGGSLADSALPAGQPTAVRQERSPPSALRLYVHAMGIVLPLLLWPFVIAGLGQPRRRAALRRELPVTLSLIGTSLAIAALVAVDARTQLFLVPLLALYAARGIWVVSDEVERRSGGVELRKGFVGGLFVATAVLWLLAIDGRRLYLSLTLGSPHHVVAEQNRAVAEELDALLGAGNDTVMSWHPAIAIYADLDWRPLPYAELPEILRYGGAAGADAAVLSAYYPPDLEVEKLGTRYLILDLPEAGSEPGSWNVRIQHGDSLRAVARVERAGP